jgi:hypothetical protein
MPYMPLQYNSAPRRTDKSSTMAPKGVNLDTYSNFLDINQALNIENYLPTAEGFLRKRLGMARRLNIGGTVPITMLQPYVNDTVLVAYGTTLKAVSTSDYSTTTIKSDFTSDDFDGRQYGDYFFITSKLNGLWRVSKIASYNETTASGATNNYFSISASSGAIGATVTDAVSGATADVVSSSGSLPGTLSVVVNNVVGTFTNGHGVTSGTLVGASLSNINPFTVGKTITGQTSGARAVILEDTAGSGSGTLTLGSIIGTFQNGEVVVDDSSTPGRGHLTTAVVYTIAQIASAPYAATCEVIGNRLFLGNLSTDDAATAYSQADTGSNPPFSSTWTVASQYTDPGKVVYRNGGTVRAIRPIGQFIVVFQDNGKFAFTIDTFDSGGTISKTDQIVFFRQDFGGSRAAILIDDGLFYANEGGLWQLASVGQTNVPFSEQEFNVSADSLGKNFFNNINLTNADFFYDARNRNLVLICAKDSNINNFGIVYQLDSKAFSFITGWSLNRVLNVNQSFYGVDAIAARIYTLFDGYLDDGNPITTDYLQEINLDNLYYKNVLKGLYVNGFLSTTSDITVAFDVYSDIGEIQENAARFEWTAQLATTSRNGYGLASYGDSGYGVSGGTSGLIESFDGCRPFIRNVKRARLHVTSLSSDIHYINWFTLLFETGGPIRRRKMSRLT